MSIDRSPGESRPRAAWWIVTAGLTLTALALAVPAVRHLREAPPDPPRPALRASWTVPPGVNLGARPEYPFGLALSPDGRLLAIPGAPGAPLHMHDLSSGDTSPWPGTEGAVQPFWSPDGSRLAFFADGWLRTIARGSEQALSLAPAPDPHGGVWTGDGVIVFAPAAAGLLQVPEGRGEPTTLRSPDAAAGDTSHRFPQLVANGRLVIAFVLSTDSSRQGLWAFSRETGEATRLAPSATQALAHGDDLLLLNDRALVVQRFDSRTGRLGRARFLTLPVGRGPRGELFATTSATGLLITAPPATAARVLRWYSRDGEPGASLGEPRAYGAVRIAPGLDRVAFTWPEPMLGTLDIWVQALGLGGPQRLSPSVDADDHPVWSPDGSRVAWVNSQRAVVVRGALGQLEDETVWRAAGPVRLSDWTRDGQWIVGSERSAISGEDIWLVSPQGGTARPYLQTPASEHSGTVSPDGAWMAYASDASGRLEVYLDRFPVPGAQVQVTNGGGTEPRWRADGRELFVRRGREILTVPAASGDSALQPTERVLEAPGVIHAWDVTADGRRLLLNLSEQQEWPGALQMIVNWPQAAR